MANVVLTGAALAAIPGFDEALDAELTDRGLSPAALAAATAAAAASATAASGSATTAGTSATNAAASATAASGSAVAAAGSATAANASALAAALAAGIYATAAAGRAAVANGVIYSAVGATSDSAVDIWQRVDASNSTLLKSYPSVAALQAAIAGGGVRETALTQVYNVATLAKAKGGAFLRVHPDYCFQERTGTAASTPSGIGGLVGTLKSADGAFFAIPGSDAVRPTLKQDRAGNYYLDANLANMMVFNAASVAFDMTTTWTHIGGWAGTGNAFTWVGATSNNIRSILISSIAFTGNTTGVTTAANVYTKLFNNTQDSVTTPHVMRVVKTPTDIAGYYNDSPSRGAAPFAPWDDSASTRRLGLFTTRPDTGGPTNYASGKFYGGLWVPGTLTADETQFATAELMALTIPGKSVAGTNPNPIILDFATSQYQWSGTTRALSDLTDNGGGSYTLTDLRSYDQEHTIIVDVKQIEGASAWSGNFLEFMSENIVNEKVQVHTADSARRIAYRSPSQALAAPLLSPNTSLAEGKIRPFRMAFAVKPGELGKAYFNRGVLTDGVAHKIFPSIPPSSLTINTAVTGWTLSRVAIYPKALTGDELNEAMTGPYDTHILGDSFTVILTPDFESPLYELVAAGGNPEARFSTDGVGGVAFFEPNGDGHTQRFALTPQHHRKILVINDGGFGVTSEAMVRSGILDILQLLNHPNNSKRYIYLESNPVNADSRHESWQLSTSWIKEITGDHFVSTLEAVFCAYSDSAAVSANRAADTGGALYVSGMTVREYDLACVLQGLWPMTTRFDVVHPENPTQIIYARAAYAAMVDLGYYPGTTTLPGVVTSLAAVGTKITWSPPADDGKHPVLGYIVQRWSGSAWVTQPAQGSKTGYTKQYIREFTAPNAADYRVAAITRKGTGAYTTVTVV